jgi:WD40 repeat protein
MAPPEIPGFYFDPEKNRYFKVEKNSAPSSHRYHADTIKSQESHKERLIKKLKRDKIELERLPKIYYDCLSVQNRLTFRTSHEVAQKARRYMAENITMEGNVTFPSAGPLKRIASFHFDKFLVSDLVNIYLLEEVDLLNSREYNKDAVPKVLVNRMDKSTSVLRTFNTFSEGTLSMRTWFGSLDEPSEIELSSYEQNGSYIGSERIVDPKRSFNTSLLNPITGDMVTCCNGAITTTNITRVSSRNMNSMKVRGDALSIDRDGKDNYYIGFRNGDLKIWDSRDRLQNSKTFRVPDMRSIINLNKVSEYEVICSSLGSKLKLYDIRMGMKIASRSYHTSKYVVNAFGENMQMISGTEFLLQSKNLVELFDISSENPLKVMTDFDRDGDPITSGRWVTGFDTLFTLSPQGIQYAKRAVLD